MEKGKILITKTKKGFAGMLAYIKLNGKPGQMPILDYRFPDDAYNNTDCEFDRDGGKLIKLIAYDGIVLVDKTATTQAADSGIIGSTTNELKVNSDDILDIKKTFLPDDIQRLASHINRHGIDNFALKLNKAAWSDGDGEKLKFYFYRQNKKGRDSLIQPPFHLAPISALAERQLKNARALLPHVSPSVFTPDWRLVVGLGGESVYETSITLHHVYGIPYIPGSSIKGVVRSWIITSYFSCHDENGQKIAFNLKKAEERAQKHPGFIDWFGSQDEAGKITFFDAFPIEAPRIEPDIMNVHYQNYYSDNKGRTAPTDYQRTNPIPFLTVSGSPFQFIIGARNKSLLESETIQDRSIIAWLKDALESHGIGAKTAVGYGYFKPS
ncbi:MAG: type III-B CRISPR module RAMP protein Cmr6 [Flavobacteriaceae bacterium]|nr:type III-B CRISPR module RAMP protein Cmr6 [Flavobacteriaceae bacterium]